MSGSFRLKQLDRAAVYKTGSRAWTETGPANSKTHTHKHTHLKRLSANKFQHLSFQPVSILNHAAHLTLPVCLCDVSLKDRSCFFLMQHLSHFFLSDIFVHVKTYVECKRSYKA